MQSRKRVLDTEKFVKNFIEKKKSKDCAVTPITIDFAKNMAYPSRLNGCGEEYVASDCTEEIGSNFVPLLDSHLFDNETLPPVSSNPTNSPGFGDRRLMEADIEDEDGLIIAESEEAPYGPCAPGLNSAHSQDLQRAYAQTSLSQSRTAIREMNTGDSEFRSHYDRSDSKEGSISIGSCGLSSNGSSDVSTFGAGSWKETEPKKGLMNFGHLRLRYLFSFEKESLGYGTDILVMHPKKKKLVCAHFLEWLDNMRVVKVHHQRTIFNVDVDNVWTEDK